MIYLKTIFSSPAEIKFLKLNMRESFEYVDKFIVCEFNFTHVGIKRELIFGKHLSDFTKEEQDKIIYIGADISGDIILAGNSREAHENEQIMRGYFIRDVRLEDDDIVVSVDADEIVFGIEYPDIFKRLNFFRKAIKLELRQFFYKINYLWTNQKFIAPTVCYAKYYKNKFPGQWRYDVQLYKKIVGCHFSWCLTVDEMLKKIGMYAHRDDYKHLATREILEDAIKNKKYPFDSSVDFNIEVLDIYKDRQYYPKSIYTMLDEFKDLIV